MLAQGPGMPVIDREFELAAPEVAVPRPKRASAAAAKTPVRRAAKKK